MEESLTNPCLVSVLVSLSFISASNYFASLSYLMLHNISPKQVMSCHYKIRVTQQGSDKRKTRSCYGKEDPGHFNTQTIVKTRPPLIGIVLAQDYHYQILSGFALIARSSTYQLEISITKQPATSSLNFQEILYLFPSSYSIKVERS